MGGAVDIVSSAIGLVTNMSAKDKPGAQTSGQYEALKTEREAQEEKQRKQEAEERKRERDKVLDARTIQKKRLAAKPSGKTTLANGGAGLLTEPEVRKSGLKEKFGE